MTSFWSDGFWTNDFWSYGFWGIEEEPVHGRFVVRLESTVARRVGLVSEIW